MAGLFRTLAMFLSNPLYSSYHPGSCCLRKSRSVLPHICFVCFEEIQPSRVLQLSPWRYKPDLIYFSHFRFFFVLPKQLPINIFVSWNDLKWISFSFNNQSPICSKKIYSLISFYSNTSSLHHPHPLRPLPPSFSSSSEDEKMWSSMTSGHWPPFQEKHTITNCIRWSQITVAYSLQDILKHITLLMSL